MLGPEDVEVFDLDTFITRLSDHMQLEASVADRIVRVAARALSTELDRAALAELERCLPATVAALFRHIPASEASAHGS